MTETGAIIYYNNTAIFNAKFVNITFECQKNSLKFDYILQQWLVDPLLCPVKILAALVTRIRSISSSTDDTPICTYQNEKGKVCIISQIILLK